MEIQVLDKVELSDKEVRVRLEEVLREINSSREINLIGALGILHREILDYSGSGEIYAMLLCFEREEIGHWNTGSCSNQYGIVTSLGKILSGRYN